MNSPQASDPNQPKKNHKKKPAPLLTPNPAPQSDTENLTLDDVEIAITPNAEVKSSVFDDLINAAVSTTKETPKEKAQAQKELSRDTGLADDLPTIISSILALTLSAVGVPDPLKPNTDEINGLSYYAARLALRHINVNAAITADTLDIIGIISISAAWYMRVLPDLGKKSLPAAKAETMATAPEVKPTDGGGQIDDSASAEFLNIAKRKGSAK